MRILTAAQAARADALAQDAGIDLERLMEQAGVAVAESAARSFGAALAQGAVILCGRGHNGGDGLVAARVLADRGVRVRVLVAGGPAAYAAGDRAAAAALTRLGPYGAEVLGLDGEAVAGSLAAWPGALVVDAVVGTGVRGRLRPDAAGALAQARARAGAILAVDLPSGVDPDSGATAEGAVAADRTLAMGALKAGHVLYPGAGLCGAIEVAGIGLGPFVAALDGPSSVRLEVAEARSLVPVRPAAAHKGRGGRLLVVAGSEGLGGAAVLSTLAALHSGAGLVTVASTESVRTALLTVAPAAMTLPLGADLAAAAEAADAVAAGPGLGRSGEVAETCRRLLAHARRLVLDADGLNALAVAGETMWAALRASPAAAAGALVLTPHPGEAARLCALGGDGGAPVWAAADGRSDARAVDRARLEAARALARASGAVVLLKGRPTVVARPDGALRLNPTGGPELAVGGTGDVLTGLIGGLLAQGLGAFDAAALGAYLHGLAGALAADGLDRAISAAEVAVGLGAAYRRLKDGAQ